MIRSQRFFNKVSFALPRSHQTERSPRIRSMSVGYCRTSDRRKGTGYREWRRERFYPPQTSFYVGVDFSLEMLRRGENRTYHKVCGEAMNLPFKEGGFNTILYLYLLHHLAQGSIGATMEAVKKALREGSICLKTGGNVIIAETCVPSFLEKVERAFFFILRVFLFFTKQSEVFLFSAETLTRILTECGYREIRTWKISG